MTVRLEEQIHRYTETIDAMASPIEELIPPAMSREIGVEHHPASISLTVRKPGHSCTPLWMRGLAVAATVLVLAIPAWLVLTDEEADLATTTPTAISTPTTAPDPTSLPTATTFLAPAGENPYLGLDEPFGNVNGHEFAPNTKVMLRVNGGQWVDIGETNDIGFFGVNGVVEVGPGDVLEIQVGGILRSLEIPVVSFDVYDVETSLASGATDLEDGTILSLHVFPTQEPVWETFEVEVSNGQWSFVVPVDFAEGWPFADITWFPEGGGAYSVHFQP